MKKLKLFNYKSFGKLTIFLFLFFAPAFCRAMPPGTLLYRTSGGGKMYGYSGDPLIYSERGIVKGVYSGHVGIYIGQEDGVDYIVEALSGGLVKTQAKYFVNNDSQEKFLGAKLPNDLTPLQQARVVALAKSLASKKLAYDFDFKKQKGPASGEWTCVGFTEKLYESADISNPNNLAALEYDPDYYAVDITPDGFDNFSVVDDQGNCFSDQWEFSKIARLTDIYLPAPELIGFDAGREYNGERYIFLPYTQFLQPTLADVPVDIEVASGFEEVSIRGKTSEIGLILRWSLINNPLSSLKNLYNQTKDYVLNVSQKIFGSPDKTEIVLNDNPLNKVATKTPKVKTATTKKVVKKSVAPKITVKKATVSSIKVVAKNSSSQKSASVAVNKSATTASSSSPKTSAAKKSAAAPTSTSTNKAAIKNSPAAPVNNPPVYAASVSNSSPAISPLPLVINRIYAFGNDDWVEIYNPTNQDFDLAAAGYRLEKAKTADDPSLMIRLGNPEDGSYPGGTVIKAQGTYLIVNQEASDYYKNQADALASRDDFAWGGSGYTIYLGSSAISSSNDEDIVDAVGFGPDATYYLGSGPALEINDHFILNRLADSDDNKLDFDLIAASDPDSAAVFNSGTNENGTTTAETATSTSETATSTSETASSSSGLGRAFINKIYSTGDNDWLELFNPTAFPLDLAAAGYRLEKAKTASDPSLMLRFGNLEDAAYPGGTIIAPNSGYLVVRDEANNYYRDLADAIVSRDEFGWTGAGYSLYLGNGPISSGTDQNLIDLVGFGSDATYYLGSGPALEISDNYILNRIADTSDNRLDFNLLPTDDPTAVLPIDDPASASFSELADLYAFPIPIESFGLIDAFHFDECYGLGRWAPGKWDCAREISYLYEPIKLNLSANANLNNFSASFYYQRSGVNPKIIFQLSNEEGVKVNLVLETNMITVDGLPNSQGRYFTDLMNDNLWHQVSLVIDRQSNYWTLYIDGQEIIKQFFLNHLAEDISRLEIKSDDGYSIIDEVVLWNRPLSQEEITGYYEADAPFSPLTFREGQRPASLIHFWNFDEGEGLFAQSSISSSTLDIKPYLWTPRSLTDNALVVTNRDRISLDLETPIQADDLSLEFWWLDRSYPQESRAMVSLKNDSQNILALNLDYYIAAFWFNNNSGVFTQGIDQGVPHDQKWHHVAVTYDSYLYKLRFYVDGEEKTFHPFVRPLAGLEVNRLEISTDGNDSQIDDLGIWKGALSPAQVKRLYQTERRDDITSP